MNSQLFESMCSNNLGFFFFLNRSTRAFCEFLLGKPEIEPPKYLTDCGMMDWKTLQEEENEDAFSHISDEVD